MLSNTLRPKFFYLKIILILHPRYHQEIIEHILKNKQNKEVCLYSWDYMINYCENEDENEK